LLIQSGYRDSSILQLYMHTTILKLLEQEVGVTGGVELYTNGGLKVYT